MVRLSQVLCAIVLAMIATCPGESARVVNTPWGQISGKDVVSPAGRTYSAYQGIPFALPPIGERRFAPPVAHPGPGAGQVFNASDFGYQCLQPDMGDLAAYFNEDCLTLNVYVPAGNSGTRPKSVMIFIHGGGFHLGGAWGYTPSELVTENDVIVVVIQYRLGIFGFLSSADKVIPGNYGLMDQILAVRWVKDNIRAFGGDPNSLTLFGESAGAMSIGYHMLSRYGPGLFSRAILQSGSYLTPMLPMRKPLKMFHYVADKTGCARRVASWSERAYYALAGGWEQAEHQRILDCLRRLDGKKAILPFTIPPHQEFGFYALEPWAPVIDGDYLPGDPVTLEGIYDNVPAIAAFDVMSGFTNDEGGFYMQLGDLFTALASSPEATKDIIALKDLFSDSRKLSREVRKASLEFFFEGIEKDPKTVDLLLDVTDFFYFESLFKGQSPSRQEVANIFSDISFMGPGLQFARNIALLQKTVSAWGPTGRNYLYLFNHYPAGKAGDPDLRGVFHAEDLAYEFDSTPLSSRGEFNADDFAVGTTFRSMLANFAKTGDPQVVVDQQTGETWPQFREDEKYLSLEVTPRVADRLYAKRAALLLDLVPSLVNSTQEIMKNARNSQMMPFVGPQKIYFKGRINFFKLP